MTWSRRIRSFHLGALASVVVASCAASTPVVEEKLDPLTGVTVTRSAAPLVLYRENSASAAHARDFVYMGPVLVNRMGRHDYYLWLGIWSTLRDYDAASQRDGFETIVLYADGEPFELELKGWSVDSIGVSEPVYLKPVATAADAFYAVTQDQIRLIAEASDVRLRTRSSRSHRYEPWENQGAARAGMMAFLEHLQY
jgi:hypothetical protein